MRRCLPDPDPVAGAPRGPDAAAGDPPARGAGVTPRSARRVLWLAAFLALPVPIAVLGPGLEACCDASVPRTIQERAWTSPIWWQEWSA